MQVNMSILIDSPIKKLPLIGDRRTGAPQLAWNACSWCPPEKPLPRSQLAGHETGPSSATRKLEVIQTALLEKMVKFTVLSAPPQEVMNPDMFSGLSSLVLP
ncbi:unnamed protein product [Arctogadus glacialis]